jgi:tetratricopeptide (TPR) repeat protein
VYPDERVARFVGERFIPVRVHVKENADEFQRLGERYAAHWTPTILELDPGGEEHHRVEGYLDAPDFLAQLTLGLGKMTFDAGRYDEAERLYREVVERYPDAEAAPEALYWAGAARYKATGNGAALAETAAAFQNRYRDSTWAKKASVWKQ